MYNSEFMNILFADTGKNNNTLKICQNLLDISVQPVHATYLVELTGKMAVTCFDHK